MEEMKRRNLNYTAAAFYLDCKNDPEYPNKTWQDQREEMKDSVSAAFLLECYEQNKDRQDIAELFEKEGK